MTTLNIIFSNSRDVSISLEEGDKAYFTYPYRNETDSTQEFFLEDLLKILIASPDWEEQLMNKRIKDTIRGWMERCKKAEEKERAIEKENWELKRQIQSLKETIKIVGTGS